MIPHTFFLRIQRGPTISSGVKAVQIVPQQLFAPEEYYVWLVDPNPVRQLVLALGMVAVVLAGVMFPLWPIKMRIGVWYLSVAVLGLVAAFSDSPSSASSSGSSPKSRPVPGSGSSPTSLPTSDS